MFDFLAEFVRQSYMDHSGKFYNSSGDHLYSNSTKSDEYHQS